MAFRGLRPPAAWRRQARYFLAVVGLAGFVVAQVYAGLTDNEALGELLLDVMFLPVVAMSYFYGRRGAVISCLSAAGFATSLYAIERLVELQVYATDSFLYLSVGLAIGLAVDKTRTATRLNSETLERAVDARTRELRQSIEELEYARSENLRRLALAVDFRDEVTAQHTERVGDLSARLASQLGWSTQEVERIREAAPLHDLGKLGIPDGILLKPGKLTDPELVQMRKHAEIGATLLAGSRSAVLRQAAEIALTHHEWWDGSGYPHGLAGDEIPLAGRITAVADVYDALTHDRPYRSAMPVADAILEIQALVGHQFDPQVVAAFNELHDLGGPNEPSARRLPIVA